MEEDAKRLIKVRTFIISLCAVFIVEATLKMMMDRIPDQRLLFLGLARLLQTGALIGVIVILQGGLAAIGLARRTLYRGMKRGLFWSAGFASTALLTLGLLSMVGFDVRSLLHTRFPDGPDQKLLFILIGAVIAPVTEEIFFRGILYGFFRRWGIFFAIALSTGIFLLAHPLKGGILTTQLVGGLVFAVAYEVEKSLLVPITIHSLGNLSIFAIALL